MANTVEESRRRLEQIHATLREQTENEEYRAILDEVIGSITDEDIQKEIDKGKEKEDGV